MADAQVVNTSFISVSKANLDSVSIIDGQLIRIKDGPGLYYDMNGVRYNVADANIKVVASTPEIGEENKLYYNLDDNNIYIYKDSEFVVIAGIEAINTMAAAISNMSNANYKYGIMVQTGEYDDYGIPKYTIAPMITDPTYTTIPSNSTILQTCLAIPSSTEPADTTKLNAGLNVCNNNGYLKFAFLYSGSPVYQTLQVNAGDRIFWNDNGTFIHLSTNDIIQYTPNSDTGRWTTSKLSDVYNLINKPADFSGMQLMRLKAIGNTLSPSLKSADGSEFWIASTHMNAPEGYTNIPAVSLPTMLFSSTGYTDITIGHYSTSESDNISKITVQSGSTLFYDSTSDRTVILCQSGIYYISELDSSDTWHNLIDDLHVNQGKHFITVEGNELGNIVFSRKSLIAGKDARYIANDTLAFYDNDEPFMLTCIPTSGNTFVKWQLKTLTISGSQESPDVTESIQEIEDASITFGKGSNINKSCILAPIITPISG